MYIKLGGSFKELLKHILDEIKFEDMFKNIIYYFAYHCYLNFFLYKRNKYGILHQSVTGSGPQFHVQALKWTSNTVFKHLWTPTPSNCLFHPVIEPTKYVKKPCIFMMPIEIVNYEDQFLLPP